MPFSRFRVLLVLVVAISVARLCEGQDAAGTAPQAYKWSVQYLIDNSESVFGRSQEVYPRGGRALAVSPDGHFLYLGYNQSFSANRILRNRDSRSTETGEVRKVDLTIKTDDFAKMTRVVLPYHRAKAIAVDDEGHVYLAEGDAIEIYDANLRQVLTEIDMTDCEGVAVTREGGSIVLYATERDACELRRFLIDTRSFSGGCTATPAGLKQDGVEPIDGAKSLRGMAIDSKGRIWIADPAVNKVFRVDSNGSNLVSTDVKQAMEIAFANDTALVSEGTAREIALVSPDMVVTGKLLVPWEELELAPYGNNRDGSLTGIAALPGGKGFLVANEHGQTANQKSTYGRTDDNSEVIHGKLYTDAMQDDNEPVLRALPVTVQDAVAVPESSTPPVPVATPVATPASTGSAAH